MGFINVSETIITSLCFCHNTGLLIHQLCKRRSNQDDFSNPLFLWTNLTLSLFIIFNLICLLSTLTKYLHIDCLYWYLMILTTYYVSKYFIWKYSLIRLRLMLKTAYSKKCLFYLSCSFIIIALLLIIFTVFSINRFKTSTKYPSYCPFNVAFWFYMLVGITESILFILCYWLFYSKLNSLNESATKISSPMLYLLRKYLVLTCVLVVSTWIRALISSFSWSIQGILCVDSAINCWYMLLLDARYDNIYAFICKCVARREWNTQSQINICPRNPSDVNTQPQTQPVVRLSLQKQLSNKSNLTTKNKEYSIGLVASKLKLKAAASAPVPHIHKKLNSYSVQ